MKIDIQLNDQEVRDAVIDYAMRKVGVRLAYLTNVVACVYDRNSSSTELSASIFGDVKQ